MYHGHFNGTHYEIGFRWGALLAKRGNYILDQIGFPITAERMRFSAACLPVYQEYFPEILEEIQGLADGQDCDTTKLQAFLFSMYAMPPACHCSCFAVSNGKQIILGRNSDFLTALEKSNQNVIYHFPSGAYAFTGNTTAFIQMEDGVNQHGLALGLASVYPPTIKPGMNAGLLLRYFLERCQTTQEVLEQIKRLPVSSAQTFTVADASGDIAVIECCAEGFEILHPTDHATHVCAANTFHSAAFQQAKITGIDDWQAEQRYETMAHWLEHRAPDITVGGAADLLSGKHGFLCQYDRRAGRDTVWSVIYDLKRRQIFRVEGNPSRRRFREDTRFRF